MDYYSILGIDKTASDSDIRKAYKKKSMQHHPDRGGNEEEFKKVNEAYQTLKDPQKKAAYDNPQVRMNSSNFNGSFEDAFGNNFNDIFSQMFGGGFRRPHEHSRRNTDVRIKVKVTLEEVYVGKKVIVTYRLRNGQEKNVNIDIPMGVRDGDTVKFQGLGDNSIPGIPPGDLFVIIGVDPGRIWRRDNDDLYRTLNVNCLELIVGTTKTLETPDGRSLELKIKPATRNNTTLSIKGYGVPNVHHNHRGNLFVTIIATIPQDLNLEQLEKIKEVIDAKIS